MVRSIKKLKILFVPLLVILICVAVFFQLKRESYKYNLDAHIDKNGLFHDIPWGTSMDEVKKIFKDDIKIKPRKNKQGELTIRGKDYDSMRGVNSLIVASFSDNKEEKELSRVSVCIFENEDTGYDIHTLRDRYIKKLSEVYGNPSTAFKDHLYEWPTLNGAVRLRVWDNETEWDEDHIWDDEEVRYKQMAITYSNYYLYITKGEKKGLFNSIDWHSTQDVFAKKIKEKLDENVDVEDGKASVKIRDYNGWDGVDVEIVGNYLSDYLIKISCEHKFDSKAKYSLEELKTLYKIKFDDFFGEPEEDTFKDTLTKYTWQTPTGSIRLLFDEEKEILILDYNEDYAKIKK